MAETVRTLYVNLELTGQDQILAALKNLKTAGEEIVRARKQQAVEEKKASSQQQRDLQALTRLERELTQGVTLRGRVEKVVAEQGKKNLKEQIGLLGQFAQGWRGAFASYLIFQAVMSKGQQIYNTLKRSIDDVIAASSEQAKVDAGLAAALADQGQYTLEAMDALKEYNSQLQLHIGIGDEVTAGIEKQIVGLTDLTADLLPRATQAVIQISAVTGKDYPAAALQFSKALEGNTQGLQKFGIKVEKGASQLEIINEVVDKTSAGMAILEAQANTYAGQQEILNQQIGEFKEGLGNIVTKSPSVLSALDSIAKSANILAGGFDEGGAAATSMGNTVAIAMTQAALAAIKAIKLIDTAVSHAQQINRGLQIASALPSGGLSVPEIRAWYGDMFGKIPLPGPGKKRLGDLNDGLDPGFIKEESYDASIANLESQLALLRRGGPVGPFRDPYDLIQQNRIPDDENAPTGPGPEAKKQRDGYSSPDWMQALIRWSALGLTDRPQSYNRFFQGIPFSPGGLGLGLAGGWRGGAIPDLGMGATGTGGLMQQAWAIIQSMRDTATGAERPDMWGMTGSAAADMTWDAFRSNRPRWAQPRFRGSDFGRPDNMMAILQGFQSGGIGGAGSAAGGIAGAGLTAGMGGFLGAAGGPLGALLGGGLARTLGGFAKKLFGGGSGRERGESPAVPIYTKDVGLADLMAEMLNLTKQNLIGAASMGTQALARQLRIQQMAQGVKIAA